MENRSLWAALQSRSESIENQMTTCYEHYLVWLAGRAMVPMVKGAVFDKSSE